MIDTSRFISENLDGVGRVYTDGKHKYPSVTTVLQIVGDNAYLEEWRAKVGDEFADKYTKFAADIGTAMHLDYEMYLNGMELKPPVTEEEKKARSMFRASLPKFKKLITEVIEQEVCVISHTYKIAGRFDLLARGPDGKIYLIDFKNTKRDKTREEIENYRLQLAFYHRMLKECRPDLEIAGHIVFMVNREGFSKVFRYSPEDTTDIELMRIRGRFFKQFGL